MSLKSKEGKGEQNHKGQREGGHTDRKEAGVGNGLGDCLEVTLIQPGLKEKVRHLQLAFELRNAGS